MTSVSVQPLSRPPYCNWCNGTDVHFDRSSRLVVSGRSDWRWLTSCLLSMTPQVLSCRCDSLSPVLSEWLTKSCLVGVTHQVLSCHSDSPRPVLLVWHHILSCWCDSPHLVYLVLSCLVLSRLANVTPRPVLLVWHHILSCWCDSPHLVYLVLSCQCDSPRPVLSMWLTTFSIVNVTHHVLSCRRDSPHLVWFWVSPHPPSVSVVLSLSSIHHRYLKVYGGVEGELQSFLTVELDGGEWSVSRFGLFYHLGRSLR